jgi:hypothetical protein
MSMNSTKTHDASEWLYARTRDAGHCDLLIDSTLGHPLADVIATQVFSAAPQPINPALVSMPVDECPLLLRLTTANLELLDASIALANRQASLDPPARPVCAWIFGATEDLSRLARHLMRQMIANDAKREKFVLRFYDPRVMPWLAGILSAQQLAQLLQPLSEWVWMNREGGLCKLGRPGSVEVTSARAGLTLSDEQVVAIDRIELLSEIIAALQRLQRPWPTAADYQLDQWLVDAAQKGHGNNSDLLAHVLHAAAIHPRFDAHPAVARAIEDARAQGRSLCSALDGFDDAFWSSIRTAGSTLADTGSHA